MLYDVELGFTANSTPICGRTTAIARDILLRFDIMNYHDSRDNRDIEAQKFQSALVEYRRQKT